MSEYTDYIVDKILDDAFNLDRSLKRKIRKQKRKMSTQYLTFNGKIKWARVYTPDEFRGAVRWTINFYPKDAKETERLKAVLNEKKTFKTDEDGEYTNFYRPTTKFIKNKIVNFTPPTIQNKDGKYIVSYVDAETKKLTRSYEDKNTVIETVGEQVLIGNGSEVEITLCIYPTAMGNGNRLENIKLIDLIEYTPETLTDEGTLDELPEGDEPW